MNFKKYKLTSPTKRRLSSITPTYNYHCHTAKSRQTKHDLKSFLNKVTKKTFKSMDIDDDDDYFSMLPLKSSQSLTTSAIIPPNKNQLYSLSSLTIKNKDDYDTCNSLFLLKSSSRRYFDVNFIDTSQSVVRLEEEEEKINNNNNDEQQQHSEWKKYLKINNNKVPLLTSSISSLVSLIN